MTFRAARHTQNLQKLILFYTSILNLEVLGSFGNHDGYDGVFLGKKDENWHIEFTQSDDVPNSIFDEDDCWVFYPKTILEYDSILENIANLQLKPISAKNPYWNVNGITVEDPDGFRVIVSNMKCV